MCNRNVEVEANKSVREEEVDSLVSVFDIEPKPKYRLEIYLWSDNPKTTYSPIIRGVLQTWKGGGDTAHGLYFCPGCGQLLLIDAVGEIYLKDRAFMGAACHRCGGVFKDVDLHSQFNSIQPVERWVEIIANSIRTLGCEMDLYLKRSKSTLRYVFSKRLQNPGTQNTLAIPRLIVDKERVLLPMKEFIRLTGLGRDEESIVRSLLTS